MSSGSPAGFQPMRRPKRLPGSVTRWYLNSVCGLGDVFSLDEGSVVLQWPDRLSKVSAADLQDWLDLSRLVVQMVGIATAASASTPKTISAAYLQSPLGQARNLSSIESTIVCRIGSEAFATPILSRNQPSPRSQKRTAKSSSANELLIVRTFEKSNMVRTSLPEQSVNDSSRRRAAVSRLARSVPSRSATAIR